MNTIVFSSDEKNVLINKIKSYFTDKLDYDMGQFDAEFLLDFFSNEIGPYFYNRGLYDAQAILEQRIDQITDSIFELEKPTDFKR